MTPFSRWEKELPKLITDARWSAIGSLKERRLIFDDFCKTSADEHKRGKAERVRVIREDFQALLNEAASGGQSLATWHASWWLADCLAIGKSRVSTPLLPHSRVHSGVLFKVKRTCIWARICRVAPLSCYCKISSASCPLGGFTGTEDDGKAAPGISADATLEVLAEQWGSDPRWQVGNL